MVLPFLKLLDNSVFIFVSLFIVAGSSASE